MTEAQPLPSGSRFVRELKPGERWIKLGHDRILIVHPDRQPVVIDVDGVETPVEIARAT